MWMLHGTFIEIRGARVHVIPDSRVFTMLFVDKLVQIKLDPDVPLDIYLLRLVWPDLICCLLGSGTIRLESYGTAT